MIFICLFNFLNASYISDLSLKKRLSLLSITYPVSFHVIFFYTTSNNFLCIQLRLLTIPGLVFFYNITASIFDVVNYDLQTLKKIISLLETPRRGKYTEEVQLNVLHRMALYPVVHLQLVILLFGLYIGIDFSPIISCLFFLLPSSDCYLSHRLFSYEYMGVNCEVCS